MTREELETLEEGDAVTMGALFPGLNSEEILLHVESKTARDGSLGVKFVASYLGVFLGNWGCLAKDGNISWSKLL